jgi:hypothetical protein
MAHFAKIENQIVETVIVIANEVLLDGDGFEQESIGVQFCHDTFGGNWIQTSYNGNFRGRYAAVGMKYDSELNEFVIVENEQII